MGKEIGTRIFGLAVNCGHSMQLLRKFISAGTLAFLLSLLVAGCDGRSGNGISRESVDSGAVLAQKYCVSCHAFADPSLLSATLWKESVLPNMGPRLGIYHSGEKFYPLVRNDPFLSRNYYPAAPVLKTTDWQHIIDYYSAVAPDSLLPEKRPSELKAGLPGFSSIAVSARSKDPSTSFLLVDTFSRPHTLLLADVIKQDLIRMDTSFQVIDSSFFFGPILYAEASPDSLVLCNVGRINPTNGHFGKLEKLHRTKAGYRTRPGFQIDSLARPVEMHAADFNGDGRTDYLVCEFGYMTGALTWYEQTRTGGFTRHLIKSLPGAIKSYVRDINGDGRPDLYVLFAQGEEGIFSFINKADGSFEEKELLRFPPVRGSTGFELNDFNGDGFTDILYTAGDNADYSPVLKPYHGIYIFLNDGRDHFKQAYFYPVNGCFKAMARDFDGDGDLDIAAISFFADYVNQPEEGFVYLENKGKLTFQARSLPGSEQGRWLTMDVNDLDGDGQPDILLGNFSRAPSFLKSASDWSKGPAFLFLRNVTQRTSKVK